MKLMTNESCFEFAKTSALSDEIPIEFEASD